MMTEYKDLHGPEESEPMDDPAGKLDTQRPAELPKSINWNLLTADEVESERLGLNQWVNWLLHTYSLKASVVPPFWHHLRNWAAARRQAEDGCYASLVLSTGELP